MGKKYQQIDTVDELIMAFQVFDRDGKGMITSVELRHILTNLGDRMLDEEAEAIVNQADPHGGGSVRQSALSILLLFYALLFLAFV
jgi:calmodulin